MIKPKNEKYIEEIYDIIKKEGNKFIQKHNLFGKAVLKFSYDSYNNYNIEIDLYKISQKEKNNNLISKSSISENLKQIILFYLELQDKEIIKINEKLTEEVYLINPLIISDPCLIEINSLFQRNNKILNPNNLEEIISNLDEQKLKIIDKKYSNKILQIFPPKV